MNFVNTNGEISSIVAPIHNRPNWEKVKKFKKKKDPLVIWDVIKYRVP